MRYILEVQFIYHLCPFEDLLGYLKMFLYQTQINQNDPNTIVLHTLTEE